MLTWRVCAKCLCVCVYVPRVACRAAKAAAARNGSNGGRAVAEGSEAAAACGEGSGGDETAKAKGKDTGPAGDRKEAKV